MRMYNVINFLGMLFDSSLINLRYIQQWCDTVIFEVMKGTLDEQIY